MASFTILFHGQPDLTDPEQQQAAFTAYKAWTAQYGVTSHPFRGRPSCHGPSEPATDLSGYGLFEAEDLAAAQAIADACPHGQYRMVEVVETVTF